MSKRIGVIADTITDTAMGKVFFESRGYEVIMRPVKENSVECVRFFQQPQAERDTYISALIKEIRSEGATDIVVYANSICGYVDVDRLCEENGMAVVTPFHAYRRLGETCQKPCVWAATVGALSGIESSLTEANPDIEVCGVYNLSAAVQIEAGLAPAQIVEQNGFRELIDFSEKAGCDCIILGCTHFPYLMSELKQIASIPVVDPADVMLELLKKNEKER